MNQKNKTKQNKLYCSMFICLGLWQSGGTVGDGLGNHRNAMTSSSRTYKHPRLVLRIFFTKWTSKGHLMCTYGSIRQFCWISFSIVVLLSDSMLNRQYWDCIIFKLFSSRVLRRFEQVTLTWNPQVCKMKFLFDRII